MEEEKKYKDIELRSEEVQEVMNHISPWVVRCGITVLALILLMILVGCWIFRYPDTLAAEVTLATEEPPAFLSPARLRASGPEPKRKRVLIGRDSRSE